MARLAVDGPDLVVRLGGPERLLIRRARAVRVPLTAVRDAAVEPDWWRALRGLPRFGRWLPDRFCAGEWRHPEGRDLVAVRERGPVVVVDLWPSSAPYARLVVSAADPEGVVRAVRRAMRPPGRHAGGPPAEHTHDIPGEPR
ncbi:hypothetical protein [Streptomyces shenzhenensis]|uniref:hypothetical protein n=1 Tax=Streptomyces shenzhenensis TaxID=943815 RepID=UPI001604E0B7|nr:hypothetical protein [Streptomyces shenzhenensis]